MSLCPIQDGHAPQAWVIFWMKLLSVATRTLIKQQIPVDLCLIIIAVVFQIFVLKSPNFLAVVSPLKVKSYIQSSLIIFMTWNSFDGFFILVSYLIFISLIRMVGVSYQALLMYLFPVFFQNFRF